VRHAPPVADLVLVRRMLAHTMNEAQVHPNRSWTAALREGVRVYFQVSLVAYALGLLVLTRCPAGFPSARDSLVALPLLYFILCSGAACLMFAYSHTLGSGIGFLTVAVAFASVAFVVRSGVGRTLLLYVSAVTWFTASFCVFLSASL
jgi:hypothetical protein